MLYPMTTEELAAYQSATSYREAASVAVLYLRRVKKEAGRPLVQVCGPISTGGLGCRTRNIERLRLAMYGCMHQGLPIFNQLMFEDMVARFSPGHGHESYDWKILEEFYRSVMYSYLIGTLYFLPSWQTSKGATYERALGEELRLTIADYDTAWDRHGRIVRKRLAQLK